MKAKAKIIFHFSLIFLLSGLPLLTSTASASPRTGVMVPLYTYPTDASWTSLIQLRLAHPAIPFVAVINPGDGPGNAIDSNYVKGIHRLQSSGIIVLGYIPTNYGSRSLLLVRKEMEEYKNWYGVNGIFFDEMSNSKNLVDYYRSLAADASSLDYSMTVGNPGTTIDSNLVGIFTNLCIYESPGMPSMAQISDYSSYGKRGFSYIAYSVSGLPAMLKSTTKYVGFLYVTNLRGSNPYSGLPSYLPDELSILSQSS